MTVVKIINILVTVASLGGQNKHQLLHPGGWTVLRIVLFRCMKLPRSTDDFLYSPDNSVLFLLQGRHTSVMSSQIIGNSTVYLTTGSG